MFFIFRRWAICLIAVALVSHGLYGKDSEPWDIYNYHLFVDDEVWRSVTPHLLPQEHPIRRKLDKIFQNSRAIANMSSLVAAGFIKSEPQKWTRVIVTRHKQLPGYIFKLYLDRQRYHTNRPEYHIWIKRCTGAKLIRKEIAARNLSRWFKVPQKWIYPLPGEPRPSPEHNCPKYFILVEEDMNLEEREKNYSLWGSSFITKQKLEAFFYIIAKLGLWDCAKPDNAPISKDGKIAFVDTQTYHHWPIGFYKLFDFLSPEMLQHWLNLAHDFEENKTLPKLP